MVPLATVHQHVSSAVWCTVLCSQRTKYCGVVGIFDCCEWVSPQGVYSVPFLVTHYDSLIK